MSTHRFLARALVRSAALGVLVLSAGCGLGQLQVVGEEQATLPALGLQTLDLDLAQGDLHLVGSAEVDAVTVTVQVLTPVGHSERRNAEVLEQLRFDLVDLGDGVATLDVALPDDAATYSLDVTVQLPATLVLEASLGAGDASISDLAGIDLCDGSGDLQIERITGDVALCDDSGDLLLTDVRGDVEIRGDAGDLRLARIEGLVRIQDGSGDIEVQDLTGDLAIVDDSGDVDVEYVRGDVDIDDSSGDIRVAHVEGSVRVSDGSGDILIDDVAQYEVLDDSSGEVVVR